MHTRHRQLSRRFTVSCRDGSGNLVRSLTSQRRKETKTSGSSCCGATRASAVAKPTKKAKSSPRSSDDSSSVPRAASSSTIHLQRTKPKRPSPDRPLRCGGDANISCGGAVCSATHNPRRHFRQRSQSKMLRAYKTPSAVATVHRQLSRRFW